ncbi:aspartate-semialdehyde dehydrogenase [Candidatus Carsonella ruddii]|uniref:aspartate-semialdehyde dehydrogenase n=1 Tax=Candidatus Carsonella ruddii PC isolate NHV TaxID=1202540 RepID=J3TWI8_CARRU|nr:aspartate-semialdehyde dehydrogenase [Candidatus Carsonella ruddii]AFP84310.1 aspartate-semialdehyde dehydrogenase [Candidatus Carsonella ruddii PC isolate NHV]
MIKLGIIGWRGLVGSIFLNRIYSSNIIKYLEIFLFSTNKILNINANNTFNFNILINMKIIVCCQGSDLTKKILKLLICKNWKGYWVDASSYLRMNKNCILIFDPINKIDILKYIKKKKIYSGCNCTVSLCLLTFKNLLKLNLIDWIISTSYQAISGAGTKLINTLINNINNSRNLSKKLLILEKQTKHIFKNENPILFNLIPWIDKKVKFGQTKEEWKSSSEASKILNKKILIDSNCVRVSSLRCHSQFFTFKIKKNLSINNLYYIINNEYVKIIKNNEINSFKKLNPFFVSGKLNLFIGRIKKSLINNKIFNLFSVGDQLLWGAAEPLKRFLEILIEELI